MAIMTGCQGKDRTPTIFEKKCPKCGHTIEIFSTDVEAACEHCGTVVYNDKLSCVQWCKYAKQCVGEEAYEQLMEVAREQKERAKNKKPVGFQKITA
ncbi:MAG: hypothetical protein U0L49_08115 [Eubacterium sp.]|nr:hypothetical protein [Eubacterium sp.]